MSRVSRQLGRGTAFTCLLIPLLARAELTVIYDSGQSLPIAPFLDVFESADEGPTQSSVLTPLRLGAADPAAWLPIQSAGLTPGSVQARSHDRPFARPFFLIGADGRSRRWLQANRKRLKEIGAVGMLVQAENREDLQAVADLADGLSIVPASASDIAKALGISHYPVLISAHGIEQ